MSNQLMACFGLGSRGLSSGARKRHDASDVLWLNVGEIGHDLSIPKALAWWSAAASAMGHFTHAAKVDDDTFVHVPNFLQAVAAAHATSMAAASSQPGLAQQPAMCFGPLAHASYSPDKFRMCGWSWQRSIGSWRRQKCGARGFSKPNPFPLGALQLLSRNLVVALGTSEAVRRFSTSADGDPELRKRESNEDVAIGYWIAMVAAERALNVSYVNINDRAPNLGCFRNGGLYRNPSPSHILLHRIKGAAGQPYVLRVMEGEAFDPVACVEAAEIEVPKASMIFTPTFKARLKAGTASVTFDGKTNMLSMRFGPPQAMSAAFLQNIATNASAG